MADEITLIDLRVKQNEADIAKIKKAFSDFSASIKDANRQLTDNKTVSQASAKATDDMANATARAAKEQAELAKRSENVERLVDRFQRAADAGDNTALAAERAARALLGLGATDAEITKVAQQLELSTKQANELNNALNAIAKNEQFGNVSQRVAGAGDVESGVRTVGGAFGAFGGAGTERAAAQAGEVFAVIEAAPRLKAALAGMPEVMKAAYQEIGGVGVGLIGATIALTAAFALAQKAQERLEKSIRGTLEQELELSSFLATANQDEIKTRLEQARAAREQLDAEKALIVQRGQATEDIKNALIELKRFAPNNPITNILTAAPGITTNIATSGTVSSGFALLGESGVPVLDDFGRSTAEFATSARIAQEQLDDNTNALALNAQEIETLSAARRKDAEITRNVIEVETQLQRQREQLADATFAALDFEQQVFTLTAQGDILGLKQLQEDVQSEAEAARSRRERIGQILSARESADIFSESSARSFVSGFTDPIDRALAELALENPQVLRDEMTRLNDVIGETNTQAEILRNEFELLKDPLSGLTVQGGAGFAGLAGEMTELGSVIPSTTAGITDVVDKFRQVSKVSQELAKLEADLDSIRAQSAAKIADIERQLAQRREDLAIDLERKLADALIDATTKRFDAQLQYNRDALKIERDLSREKIAIQRKFAQDSALSIADRDVLGFRRAEQTRNEALQEAKEGAEEQRQALSENYQAQLETINRALDQQQQSIRRNYDRQLEDAQRQAQRQIQLENQRATQALNLRQQAYNAELQQLNQFAVGGVSQLNSFANSGLQAINAFVTGAANQLNSLSGALSGASGGGSSASPASLDASVLNILNNLL